MADYYRGWRGAQVCERNVSCPEFQHKETKQQVSYCLYTFFSGTLFPIAAWIAAFQLYLGFSVFFVLTISNLRQLKPHKYKHALIQVSDSNYTCTTAYY